MSVNKEEFPWYLKDVEHLKIIDIYRILDLYGPIHPALQHAAKKIICGGKRGHKDEIKDIKEAIVTLKRFLEMREEDGLLDDPEDISDQSGSIKEWVSTLNYYQNQLVAEYLKSPMNKKAIEAHQNRIARHVSALASPEMGQGILPLTGDDPISYPREEEDPQTQMNKWLRETRQLIELYGEAREIKNKNFARKAMHRVLAQVKTFRWFHLHSIGKIK